MINYLKLIKKVNCILYMIKEKILILLTIILFLGILNLYSLKIFEKTSTKILLFIILLWSYDNYIKYTIINGILLLIIYQMITNNKINENFEPINNNKSQYLEKPLLKLNELEKLGNNIDLNLINPNDEYNKSIEKGVKLLKQSKDMENELKSNYDEREFRIMNNTKAKALELIKTGTNGQDTDFNSKLDEIYNHINNL